MLTAQNIDLSYIADSNRLRGNVFGMKIFSTLFTKPQRPAILAGVLSITILFTTVWAEPAIGATLHQAEFHTVRSGDTWASIAAYYIVPVDTLWRANGVVNPTRLAEGQRLLIPAAGSRTENGILLFEIKPGTSTWLAALESGNSLSSILLINGLASPLEAFGQRLYAPNRQSAIMAMAGVEANITPPTVAPLSPTATPAQTPTPSIAEGALIRSRIGIQGHFLIEDNQRRQLLDMVAFDLRAGWVKQQVEWAEFEYAPGQYSDEMVSALDAFVHDAFQRGLNVMLSIAKAPDWARTTTEADGPPVDYAAYNNFVKFIVLRYKYMLSAIEIWNEPNLRREWTGAPISGTEYVRLLAGAYDTIKREYPEGNVTVISAGLAPTGINDGISAVSDRVFFRQMYQAGVQNYADAIGIHPYSWGNPPWTRCCGDWGGAPTHNDDPTFYFLNTIEDYRAIQQEFGDDTRPLWATEFGWGTMDGLDLPIPEDAPFFAYVNQGQQAEYIVAAYRMAQEWPFMGPMVLWNLNIATLQGFDTNQGGYSILRGNLQPRQAYTTLRDTPKIDS